MADKSLNRTELVAAVAAESGQSQAAVNAVLDGLFSTLSTTVKEGTKSRFRAGSLLSAPTVPHAPAATRRPAPPSRSLQATV